MRSLHERAVAPHVRAARWRAGIAFAAFAGGVWIERRAWKAGLFAGDGEGEVVHPAAWLLGLGLVAGALALAARGWWMRLALVLAMVLVGAGWSSLRLTMQERDALPSVLGRLQGDGPRIGTGLGASSLRGSLASVEGIVLERPRLAERSGGGLERYLPHTESVRLVVRVRGVVDGGRVLPASGVVRAWIDLPGGFRGRSSDVSGAPARATDLPSPLATHRAGDAVRLTGVLIEPKPATNPGAVDRRVLAAQDGVVGSLTLPGPALVETLVEPAWLGANDRVRAGLARAREALRERAQSVVDIMLDARSGGGGEGENDQTNSDAALLVRGLLLGDLPHDPDGLQATFTRLGLLHALTISGFHLAVMAMVSLTIVRLTGDRGWVEPALVAALVIAYSLIVPPNSPVLRSALMVLLLLAGEALGRRYDRLTLLFWIGLVVLAVRPLDLWSLGFQLTFGLTGLLYVVVPEFSSRVLGPIVRGPVPGTVGASTALARVVGQAFAVNASCWLASAPLVLLRTGLASPIAVVAGLIVGPLVVVVLWLAYVALLMGMIVPAIAGWLGWPVRASADLVAWMAQLLDRVPLGSLRLPPVSIAWTLAATVLLVIWMRRGWWKRARGWLVVGVLGAWLAAEWMRPSLSPEVRVRVDMLSVGDGSCLLVRSGRNAMLWDAGSLTAGLGSREIPGALRSLGVWRVPTVVVTHPDLDHYGLLPDLIAPLGVREVLLGERFLLRAGEDAAGGIAAGMPGPEAFLLEELRRRGVRVRTVGAGERLALGECEVSFLSPMPDAPFGRDNEHSLVATVRKRGDATGPAEVLLTGDVATEAIDALVARLPTLQARVMEVPHHGSADPRAIEWMSAVNPAVALQSTGPRRVMDHRWSLARSGRAWLCTATDGAAWAEVLRDGTVRAGAMR